jgi:hypothetical protein
MSRKRIVINLDAPPGSPAASGSPAPGWPQARAAKKRRWPKVLGILFTLFVIAMIGLAAGGFFLWRYYQSTPAYALSLMIDAAQRGDTPEFEKRLDDDAIAKNMVAAVSEKAAARYGIALSDKVRQQIDSSMPSLLQQVKPAIHDEVSKQIKEFASKSEPKPFILLVAAVSSLMTITTEGDSAKASALLNNRRFELALKRGAEGWKVTDFKDDAVVQRIVDNVMKQLPAIGSFDLNNPLLKPRKRSSSRGR